jgi:FkbM family methyltransferase
MVVDVGAYVGVYSILAILSGCGNVIAYNPYSNTFQRLEIKLRIVIIKNRFKCRSLALSGTSEGEELVTPKDYKFSSGTQLASIVNI